MKVFNSTDLAASEFKSSGTAAAIGNYDGVHFGHQHIIKRLITIAKANNLKPILLTFEPHPVKILSPATAPQLLFTREQKIEAVENLGIEVLVFQPFNDTFSHISPEDFVSTHLKKNLNVKHVLVGYDFTFGYKRSGTTEKLEKLCTPLNIKCEIIPAQMLDETLVSSSLIRKLIQNSNIELANKLLTREYFIDGSVVKGHQRGTALGIHTANLATVNELIPPDGVYATRFRWKGKIYNSVTNIGFNPTFNNTARSIETHIFDFDDNVYDSDIRLYFVAKLREEIRFANPDALVQQIKKDILQAKKILK